MRCTGLKKKKFSHLFFIIVLVKLSSINILNIIFWNKTFVYHRLKKKCNIYISHYAPGTGFTSIIFYIFSVNLNPPCVALSWFTENKLRQKRVECSFHFQCLWILPINHELRTCLYSPVLMGIVLRLSWPCLWFKRFMNIFSFLWHFQTKPIHLKQHFFFHPCQYLDREYRFAFL